MSISEYRQQKLAEVNRHRAELDDETKAPLELAQSKDQIGKLIETINDGNATPQQKGRAIDLLNAVSNFSPVIRTKMPEFVNALRGQMGSPDRKLRQRAIGTLTALKDEVVQEILQEEIQSDKKEEDRLVPTATAIAMLGRDEKALPAGLLKKIMSAPPDEASLVAAIRHMPSDPDASAELLAVMRNEKAPLVARAMIPEMVGDADPEAFLKAAQDILKAAGADNELAPWLVKGVAAIREPKAAKAIQSVKKVVAGLRDTAPAIFQSAADDLLKED